jgi:flagellar hook protein FlgE
LNPDIHSSEIYQTYCPNEELPMLTALATALSGMNAESTAIDVVSNNLANLNTTGFKASSTIFDDLVSQTLGAGGSTQIGMGVQTPLTRRVFSPGSIQSSSGPLDVAIQGDGFLVVKNSSNATLYTRAGNLTKDSSGNITTATGEYVQGWSAVNGAVNTSGPLGNLTVPVGALRPAVATTNISLTANLDATSPAVAAPQTASNASFSNTAKVYDSLGTSHIVTVNYWSNGANSWNWQATIPGADVGSASPNVAIGSGSLTFNSSGILTTPAPGAAAPVLSVTGLADSAANLTMNLTLYNGSSPLLTQFSQTSTPEASSIDGNASVQLSKVSIGDGGMVVATYSDGTNVTVGQLAMANFVNPDSLLAVGSNNFEATGVTSNPAIGVANAGGRGQILGSSLESSTSDIATEFTNLMVDQRAYQANSKVITTADQINQALIALIQ